MEKILLLIDDSPDYIGVLDNIKTFLSQNESINLINKYIDPNDREYWNIQKDPDLGLLISGVKSKLNSIKPDLIIVDQYYSGNEIFKGLDVIEKLRSIPKIKSCPIFLISGKRDTIIREIFEAEELSNGDKVKSLAKLINLKIERFLDKDFKSEAIECLKQTKLDDILPTKLRDYEGENAVINQFSPKYKTLTFTELADKIENNDPDTKIILDEIFEFTLSFYTEIDEKL